MSRSSNKSLLARLTAFCVWVHVCTVHAATVLPLGNGPQSSNSTSAVGMNLDRPNSWSPTYLFVDAILKTRSWIAHRCDGSAWDTGLPLSRDAAGWINQPTAGVCPGLFLLDEDANTAQNSHYVPLGTYVLIWEGQGTLNFHLPSGANPVCTTSSCSQVDFRTIRSTGTGPHRATFTLGTAGNTATNLRIMDFAPANYIRNMHVILPGGNVVTGSTLDYKAYCQSPRGPTGPEPLAVQPLGTNQSCRDFEQTYWDRYRDSLTLIHRYSDLSRSRNPVKVLFHPASLKGLADWRTLRAMDWMHTNVTYDDSGVQGVTAWSQRTDYKHLDQTETQHGPAFEYLLSLANVLGADLWVNVPYQASDDYITQFATLLRDNVHSRLKVYVEYSNEIWNASFRQGDWVESQCVNDFPGSDAYTKRLKCQAKLATNVAKKFNTVYGRLRGRVVNVIAGQAANSGTADILLNSIEANQFSAYAIAPYFGDDTHNRIPESATLNDVFPALSVSISEAVNRVTQNKLKADSKNLRLITYELGQHLVPRKNPDGSDQYVDLFVAANRDVNMNLLTAQYLSALKQAGVNELSYYHDISVFGRYGSWGSRESPLVDDAVKWNAIKAFKSSSPCWWTGCGR